MIICGNAQRLSSTTIASVFDAYTEIRYKMFGFRDRTVKSNALPRAFRIACTAYEEISNGTTITTTSLAYLNAQNNRSFHPSYSRRSKHRRRWFDKPIALLINYSNGSYLFNAVVSGVGGLELLMA